MANTASAVPAIIDLRPARYQSSLNSFRMLFETSHDKSPTLRAGVRARPARTSTWSTSKVRMVGTISMVKPRGCKAGPAATGSNYNQLGHVGNVVYDDLNRLGELAQFRKGGASLDKRLCAILFAVTS